MGLCRKIVQFGGFPVFLMHGVFLLWKGNRLSLIRAIGWPISGANGYSTAEWRNVRTLHPRWQILHFHACAGRARPALAKARSSMLTARISGTFRAMEISDASM